jgi:hypothetical protein
MKLQAFFLTLFFAASALALSSAELITQAETDLKSIEELSDRVGMNQDNSNGILSALGQNYFVAEAKLKEMRNLEKANASEAALESLASEIRSLALESQDLAR